MRTATSRRCCGSAANGRPMATAAEVREALTRRWPEAKYLHIPEATFNPWRQGSKIDVAVIACWQSLKWEIDAVEVKVSLSDFKKEIERYYWTVEGDGDRHHPSRLMADYAARSLSMAPPYSYTDPGPLPAIRRHSEPCTHKSEPWRQVAHRFWIACPMELARKIKPLLPDGWGLLGVDGRGAVTVVKPTNNPEPRQ